MPYLPYEEPGIITILSLTSFLLLLNGVRYIFDRLLYCGIIGEIIIGVIWGLPVGGTAWLAEGMQETIQAFGYLGLVGLVFEGGLTTNLTLLRKTAYMSISVATIGLLMPIALSFVLLVFPFSSSSGTVYPSPLAGFSAGASLCSTSLGTTFAILSSAGMQQTRVGVVLVGAAMMDDVVGLVMVNIVTTLGEGGMGGWPIARPIVASFGVLLITLALAPWVLSPLWRWILAYVRPTSGPGSHETTGPLQKIIKQLIYSTPHLSFVLSTAALIIFVTIAAFIDASVLFAAFIAGGVVSFLWSHIENQDETLQLDGPSTMYEHYFKSVMDYILVPFFFASIGFSIPITDMFQASIVWKGIAYSTLMVVAKGLVCFVIYYEYFLNWLHIKKKPIIARITRHIPLRPISRSHPEASRVEAAATEETPSTPPHAIAMLVGFAMIARGEIGFLIASLSQSSGTLTLRNRDGSDMQSGEEVFLAIVWAVVLCTIAGPFGVGITVRRIRQRDLAVYRGWL
ncbi:Sodium/hydrogen exchanger [Stipitochalara longipes BDJ]|nr:Sodium/hydrogen exchanger [Stipitochalara longipes BDJ]